MKNIYKTLSIALCVLSASAFAQQPSQPRDPNRNFAEIKQSILKRIHEHEQCVNSAKSKEDLKQCRPHHAGPNGPDSRPERREGRERQEFGKGSQQHAGQPESRFGSRGFDDNR